MLNQVHTQKFIPVTAVVTSTNSRPCTISRSNSFSHVRPERAPYCDIYVHNNIKNLMHTTGGGQHKIYHIHVTHTLCIEKQTCYCSSIMLYNGRNHTACICVKNEVAHTSHTKHTCIYIHAVYRAVYAEKQEAVQYYYYYY